MCENKRTNEIRQHSRDDQQEHLPQGRSSSVKRLEQWTEVIPAHITLSIHSTQEKAPVVPAPLPPPAPGWQQPLQTSPALDKLLLRPGLLFLAPGPILRLLFGSFLILLFIKGQNYQNVLLLSAISFTIVLN